MVENSVQFKDFSFLYSQFQAEMKKNCPDQNVYQFFAPIFKQIKIDFINSVQNLYDKILNFYIIQENINWISENYSQNPYRMLGQENIQRINKT